MHILSACSYLRHEEEIIRFVVRNILELDMHKRNVSRVHQGWNCLGFEIKANGKFLTKVNRGFGAASDLPHLNLLACNVSVNSNFVHPPGQSWGISSENCPGVEI